MSDGFVEASLHVGEVVANEADQREEEGLGGWCNRFAEGLEEQPDPDEEYAEHDRQDVPVGSGMVGPTAVGLPDRPTHGDEDEWPADREGDVRDWPDDSRLELANEWEQRDEAGRDEQSAGWSRHQRRKFAIWDSRTPLVGQPVTRAMWAAPSRVTPAKVISKELSPVEWIPETQYALA